MQCRMCATDRLWEKDYSLRMARRTPTWADELCDKHTAQVIQTPNKPEQPPTTVTRWVFAELSWVSDCSLFRFPSRHDKVPADGAALKARMPLLR